MSATRFIPLLLCDAFAEECFAGNPAAVCYIPTEVYQPNGGVSPTDPRDVLMGRAFAKIANEMNLSETAFVYRLPEAAVAAAKATIKGDGEGHAEWFGLRWFTPATEVPLCGHATLGAAHALFDTAKLYHDASTRSTVEGVTNDFILPENTKKVHFLTLSGVLSVARTTIAGGEGYEMHFPFNKPDVITGLLPPSVLRDLEKALHVEEGTVLDIACNRHLRYYAARLKSGAAVEHCVAEETTLRQVFLSEAYLTAQKQHPDLIHPISALGVIAEDDDTERSDVISRFFAPWLGVLEDPVTGSWCTVFVPNWLQAHDRLTVGSQLRSYQASRRGGKALCEVLPDEKVSVAAPATTFLYGKCKLIVQE